MLTLSDSRQFGAFTVYRDFALVDGLVQFTNTFYSWSPQPRFKQVNGDPAFDFLYYRTAAGSATKAGGIVTFTVDISLTAGERDSLVQSIGEAYGISLNQVDLRPVTFKSGTAALSYAGESTAGEFVNQISGSGPARLAGSESATFLIDLSRDGAALLWEALAKNTDVFHLKYDWAFDHRLANVHMRVWCNVSKSLASAADWVQSQRANPRPIGASLASQNLAGVEIVSEAPLPPEQKELLQKSGDDLLARALESALFQQKEAGETGISKLKLRLYTPEMESSLNFSLDQSYPLEQHAALDAVLEVNLTPEQAARRLREIDLSHGPFQILAVQIVCTADFAGGLIDSVHMRIEHRATSNQLKVTAADYVFKAGAAVTQFFRVDLDQADGMSYRYSIDIYYHGETVPLHLDFPETEGETVILDVESLGVLDVTVELHDVPFEVVTGVVAELRHAPEGRSETAILNGQNMAYRWLTIIRDSPAAWEYKVDWLLSDGQRVAGTWVSALSRWVYLDAPINLRITGRVQVIATGDFSELSEILVDLRPPSDSVKQKQISLSGSGESQSWQSTAAPGQLTYEYRCTFVYKDGHIRSEPEWVVDSRPVLAVMDDSRFQVAIVPKLLDLGSALKLAVLELESSGDAPEKKTLVVRSKDDQLKWSFAQQSADHHSYRYRLTAVPAVGERQAAAWVDADSSILVLQVPHS